MDMIDKRCSTLWKSRKLMSDALLLACEAIDTHCPADIEEGAAGICKECDCDNNTAKCWRKYFLMKARDKHDKTRDPSISSK